jgi:TetR/AcrR family acrAB operon transcriptional repressor
LEIVMRRTKEEAAQTRQTLLDAALTVFSRDGYEAARLKDIAQAADVTRGAIYHHFGSKAGLFEALIEDASALGSLAVSSAIEEGGTFAEITARILVYTLNLLQEDRRFREITALSLSLPGTAPELASFREQRALGARSLVENISGLFQMGIKQGDLRADLDPPIAARGFLAYQNGLAFLWLSDRDAFSIKENTPALANMFMKGIIAA